MARPTTEYCILFSGAFQWQHQKVSSVCNGGLTRQMHRMTVERNLSRGILTLLTSPDIHSLVFSGQRSCTARQAHKFIETITRLVLRRNHEAPLKMRSRGSFQSMEKTSCVCGHGALVKPRLQGCLEDVGETRNPRNLRGRFWNISQDATSY